MYIEGKTHKDIDYTQQAFPKGEYEICQFTNCDFSEIDLTEIKFFNSEFINCNLSNARIELSSFQEVTFDSCKMLGLQFEHCNDFGFEVIFKNCQLQHSSFYRMKLMHCRFDNSQLVDVDFTEADLSGAVLLNCELSGAIFDHTNLAKADLRNSVHYSIDPDINRIKGARFSWPEVLGLLDKYKIKIDM